MKQLSIDAVRARLKQKHNGKIKLMSALGVTRDKHKFKCINGHEWSAILNDILRGTGCAECKGKKKITVASAKRRIYATHGNKVILLSKSIANNRETLKFSCDKGHTWYTSLGSVINTGSGCSKCYAIKRRLTHEQVTNVILEVHGHKIEMISSYAGSNKNHKFKCDVGHEWTNTPAEIMRGAGCRTCYTTYSRSYVSIEWLNQIRKLLPYKIRAYDWKIGEKRLRGADGKSYTVDGWCKDLKLIFEFHGDCFHGNLNIYKQNDKCHPFDRDITAKRLYTNTIRRENNLIDAGYTVVSVWEADYRNGMLYSSISGAPKICKLVKGML